MLIATIGVGTAVGSWFTGRAVLGMVRRRSLRASRIVWSAIAVLAQALATLEAMSVSRFAGVVALAVCLPATVVTVTLAFLLERALSADCQALRLAISDLGGEAQPATPHTAISSAPQELACTVLAEVGRELTAARASVGRSRELERELERSRREILVQATHDMCAPVARLQEMAKALEDGVAVDRAVHYTSLREAVDQLSAIVEKMFEFSCLHADCAPASRWKPARVSVRAKDPATAAGPEDGEFAG